MQGVQSIELKSNRRSPESVSEQITEQIFPKYSACRNELPLQKLRAAARAALTPRPQKFFGNGNAGVLHPQRFAAAQAASDAAAAAALAVVSVGAFVVTAWPAPLLRIPLAVTYAPLVMMMARLGWRWRTESLGDESIEEAKRQASGQRPAAAAASEATRRRSAGDCRRRNLAATSAVDSCGQPAHCIESEKTCNQPTRRTSPAGVSWTARVVK